MLRTGRRGLLLALTACLQWIGVQAETYREVGVLQEIPALTVLVDADFAAYTQALVCEARQGKENAQAVNDTIADNAPVDSLTEAHKNAQPAASNDSLQHAPEDSLQLAVDTAKLRMVNDSVSDAAGVPGFPKRRFVPKPQRALWLSLVFPGAGQIYNRKYWKLPIIYGGFLGCAYALMWNQQMYRDYSQAYLDIMDDNPATDSYLEMLPPRYDITGKEEQFKNLFKRKKDFYRRYRDLSAFCFVGVYLLSVIDAYVDAQLSEFDITPDLSLSVEPAVMGNSGVIGGSKRSAAYGVGCSFRF